MTDSVIDIHRDIVNGCRENNSQSQFELYKLYSKAMYNTCLRICKDPDDSKDVLQEAFVKAFTHIDTFHGESTIGAWLKKIVVNTAINFVNRKRPDMVRVSDDSELEEKHAEVLTVSDISSLDIQKVKEGIDLLPDGYRLVFSLYMVEGYDHQEISQILKISESTSKSQLNRAKKKLREILFKKMNYG
jgi:RNA polymerase sigma-70 factor (ECF subfamily)